MTVETVNQSTQTPITVETVGQSTQTPVSQPRAVINMSQKSKKPMLRDLIKVGGEVGKVGEWRRRNLLDVGSVEALDADDGLFAGGTRTSFRNTATRKEPDLDLEKRKTLNYFDVKSAYEKQLLPQMWSISPVPRKKFGFFTQNTLTEGLKYRDIQHCLGYYYTNGHHDDRYMSLRPVVLRILKNTLPRENKFGLLSLQKHVENAKMFHKIYVSQSNFVLPNARSK